MQQDLIDRNRNHLNSTILHLNIVLHSLSIFRPTSSHFKLPFIPINRHSIRASTSGTRNKDKSKVITSVLKQFSPQDAQKDLWFVQNERKARKSGEGIAFLRAARLQPRGK